MNPEKNHNFINELVLMGLNSFALAVLYKYEPSLVFVVLGIISTFLLWYTTGEYQYRKGYQDSQNNYDR